MYPLINPFACVPSFKHKMDSSKETTVTPRVEKKNPDKKKYSSILRFAKSSVHNTRGRRFTKNKKKNPLILETCIINDHFFFFKPRVPQKISNDELVPV